MRKIVLSIFGLLVIGAAHADQAVNGYVKKDGTYVQPYIRTTPNTTPADNYSTKGNGNPYTGQQGSVDPYKPKQ